jgi:hypothetical protein
MRLKMMQKKSRSNNYQQGSDGLEELTSDFEA